LTFLNGDTTIYYDSLPTDTGASRRRLVAQFDASSMSSGLYPLSVTAHDQNLWLYEYYLGLPFAVTANGWAVVVNGNDSPIAKGWDIAGLQRVYAYDNNNFVVVNGDGSFTRFDGNGLSADAADFSSLSS
jgi:hypothetical protein